MADQKTILAEASEHIFSLFKEKLSHEYVYHNFQHTYEIVETCRLIAKAYPLQSSELNNLILAAWFHDAGYVSGYDNHEERSAAMAEQFLKERDYPKGDIAEVIRCILATKREDPPRSLISQILCDADISQIGERSFFIKSDLLRAEWENFDIRHCNALDWARTQLNFLLSENFHTQEAQRLFGEQLQKNIQEQRQRLLKIERKQAQKRQDQGKSKAQPKRGIETMFRSLYKSHINFSAIADSKANMMINIHSLIISITLTLVGARFSIFGSGLQHNQIIILPVICLLLTSLCSIIFAILSAKPKVTKAIASIEEFKANDSSILFFGNYTRVSIGDFEEEIRILMKEEDLLYGNMIKDLYYLGRVLRKKYRLLRMSYLVFMIGLIITVLSAVVVVGTYVM